MKTIEEIRDWLLANAVDNEGDLILSDLDLSDFDGDVYIDDMKVKKSLHQDCQKVGENLHQDCQKVGGKFINQKLYPNEYWEEKEFCVVRKKRIDYKEEFINKLESILQEIEKIKEELDI